MISINTPNRCKQFEPVQKPKRSPKKKHADKPITVKKLKPLQRNIYQYDNDEQIDSDDSSLDSTCEDEQIKIKLSEIKKQMKNVKRTFDNGDHHPILSSELIVPQYESQTASNAKATRKKFYQDIARKINEMQTNNISPTKQITKIIEATLSTAQFVKLRDSGCTTQEIIDFANSTQTNTSPYLKTLDPDIKTRNFIQPYQHIKPCEWGDEKLPES